MDCKELMLDTTTLLVSYDTSADTIKSSDRDFHESETSTYWLPKDEEEQLRLTGVSTLYFYVFVQA